jgi:hypothetical protein
MPIVKLMDDSISSAKLFQAIRGWRDVCCAGMRGGGHTAMVLVLHQGGDSHEAEDVLRRRWPEVVAMAMAMEQ